MCFYKRMYVYYTFADYASLPCVITKIIDLLIITIKCLVSNKRNLSF